MRVPGASGQGATSRLFTPVTRCSTLPMLRRASANLAYQVGALPASEGPACGRPPDRTQAPLA
jgi:hypothetical protein